VATAAMAEGVVTVAHLEEIFAEVMAIATAEEVVIKEAIDNSTFPRIGRRSALFATSLAVDHTDTPGRRERANMTNSRLCNTTLLATTHLNVCSNF
jgi:hypothetical protein